jgi:hypothetical protein
MPDHDTTASPITLEGRVIPQSEPEPEISAATREKMQRLEEKDRCMAEITEHLEKVGPHSWNAVKSKYPKITDRTFWKYVAQVRGRIAQANATPEPRAVRMAIQTLTVRAQAAVMKEHIPHPPPPAIIEGLGAEGKRKLDFLMQIEGMLTDCEALRVWSMRLDEEVGDWKIHNPLYFEKSIQRREEVLSFALNAYKALWDVKRMQELYDAVIDTVAEVDPEAGRKIMERLRILDDQRGMTMNARAA